MTKLEQAREDFINKLLKKCLKDNYDLSNNRELKPELRDKIILYLK